MVFSSFTRRWSAEDFTKHHKVIKPFSYSNYSCFNDVNFVEKQFSNKFTASLLWRFFVYLGICKVGNDYERTTDIFPIDTVSDLYSFHCSSFYWTVADLIDVPISQDYVKKWIWPNTTWKWSCFRDQLRHFHVINCCGNST